MVHPVIITLFACNAVEIVSPVVPHCTPVTAVCMSDEEIAMLAPVVTCIAVPAARFPGLAHWKLHPTTVTSVPASAALIFTEFILLLIKVEPTSEVTELAELTMPLVVESKTLPSIYAELLDPDIAIAVLVNLNELPITVTRPAFIERPVLLTVVPKYGPRHVEFFITVRGPFTVQSVVFPRPCMLLRIITGVVLPLNENPLLKR